MNTINTSIAFAILQENIHKQLLSDNLEKKVKPTNLEVLNLFFIENVNKPDFINLFNTNMNQSVEKFKTSVNAIIQQ